MFAFVPHYATKPTVVSPSVWISVFISTTIFPQLPVVSGALLPSGHCAACLQTSHFCVIGKFDNT